jgi:Flp pilus assembly pilin Flp
LDVWRLWGWWTLRAGLGWAGLGWVYSRPIAPASLRVFRRRKTKQVDNMKVMAMLKNFWFDEDGGESAEWPLILALVAVAAIVAFTALGTQVSTKVTNLGTSIGT